jgi:chromate transporter
MAVTAPSSSRTERDPRLREVAAVFLKLGTIAFGGPAAHIAMMEDEFVRRRAWLSRQEFLDLVGAASLIPGPSSTELAIYVGYRRAGWRGLLVGGSCFILPAALIVTALAWAYVRIGRLPEAGAILYGVKAVVIAIIAQALFALARTAIKTKVLLLLGVLGVAASLFRVNPLAILVGAGLLHALRAASRRPADRRPIALLLGAGAAASGSSALVPVSLTMLFLLFFKIGAIVFGSGYVLLAFLRADLVEGTRWLTEAQLLDAVAIGQVTPGPVFTTATFIGYLLAGPLGAIVATLAIFLPSFFLVAASGPLIPRIRRSPVAAAFLDGVNAGAVALILVVAWQLGRTALVDVTTIVLAMAGFVLLIRFRLNSAWLVAAGGVVGWLSG